MGIAGASQEKPKFHSVYFETGLSQISPEENKKLKAFLSGINAELIQKVIITGHADLRGDSLYNIKLSESRTKEAEKIINESLGKNIPRVISWRGENQPLAKGDAENSLARNRRVDIQVFLKTPEPPVTLGELLKKLESPEQKFVLREGSDTLFYGAKGTIISCTHSQFEDENGNVISGPIHIYLKESFDLLEMFGDNLSTETTDGLLETRGSLKISARQNQKSLRLKKNTKITFMVPNRNKYSPMDLWDGQSSTSLNRNVTTWQRSTGGVGNFVPGYCRPPVTITTNVTYKCRFNCKVRTFLGFKNTKAKRMVSTSRVVSNSSPYCAEFDSLVKKYNIKSADQLYRLVYKPLMIKYQARSVAELFKKMDAVRKNQIAQKVQTGNAGFEDLNYYVFQTENLAWKNLDEFMKWPENKVVKKSVNLSHDKETSVRLIFKERKMIVAAYIDENGKYHYPTLPKGEKGTLVALKVEKGAPVLAIKEIEFDNQSENLSFSPVKPDELKTKLREAGL